MYLSLIKTLTVKPGSVSLRSHKCTEFGPNQFGSVIVVFFVVVVGFKSSDNVDVTVDLLP